MEGGIPMSKIKEMIKKHWITAWIILAIMGIVSTVALAEYMGQKKQNNEGGG
jgi:multisubunit Na+/H+ antiporter MnhF subunit